MLNKNLLFVIRRVQQSVNILLLVSGLLADQTTKLPKDVAVRALEQFARKIDWLYFPTGLLKSSSPRGGAKYSMFPFRSCCTFQAHVSLCLRPSYCTSFMTLPVHDLHCLMISIVNVCLMQMQCIVCWLSSISISRLQQITHKNII